MQRDIKNGSESSATSKVLRVAQAARALDVSPRTIWRLLSLDQLERVQIGRAVRITRDSIDRFVSEGGAK